MRVALCVVVVSLAMGVNMSRGERSTKVIASDPVQGLLRPKWTRAMSERGSAVNMFRFKGDIYFVHGDEDGQRGVADPEL